MPDGNRAPGAKVEEVLPTVTIATRERLLKGLLRGVSRTFYLTLRALPRSLRGPVGLAYLLARAADTIADTRLLPPRDRLKHLLAFRGQIEGPATVHALGEIRLASTDKGSTPDERALLAFLPELFSMLEALPEADRARVRSVVVTLTRGMEMDLTNFPAEDSGRIVALKDAAELDRYVYYVAGCVGEFWTEITMAHTAPLKGWDANGMAEIGVRFGKALQLTNVLRDIPRDLRIGRCYLPETELTRAGVTPKELLDPSVGSRARPVLAAGIEAALEHYRASEGYVLAMPRRCLRLRLAALWPVLIGLATLARLAGNEGWLDPARPTRVTRGWIYRMLVLSVPCALSDGLIRAWIGHLRKRVGEGL